MGTPEDLLETAQSEFEAIADATALTELDRRTFLFRSLLTAAAATFATADARAQAVPGSGRVGATASEPFRLGNSEPPAEQFMPYPGGTGALMERLVRERGAQAFERSQFAVENWSGPVPTSEEAIAFLPAHRLAALLQARRITSVYLTTIYLERLKRLNPMLNCAVTIMEASALAEAARSDAELVAGRADPCTAFPMA